MAHGLWFHPSSSPTLIVSYSNANWASWKDSYCSTPGPTVLFSPNLIAWRSKKQLIVSKSFTKADDHTVGHTIAETVWIRKLLDDLGVTLFKKI